MSVSTISNLFKFWGEVWGEAGWDVLDLLYRGDPVASSLFHPIAQSARISDAGSALSQDDDGIASFSLDGDIAQPISYLGSGVLRIQDADGAVVSQPIMFFRTDTMIYGHAPDGLPDLGAGEIFLDIDPVAPFSLPTLNFVDGTADGDLIDMSYVDPDGDRLTDGPDFIFAYGGNDTIIAGPGDNTVFAGAGDDLVYAGPGNDTLNGEEGDDTLIGGAGDNKLVGGQGNDLLIAGGGNNLMIGDENAGGDRGGLSPDDPPEPGFGNDTLVSGTGNDTMYGGSGDDVFVISDGFGNHLIVGGETGETDGDLIDGSGVTQDMTVVYTADEAGTISRDDGAAEIDFSEIERMTLGSGDDRVTVMTSTTGTVDGADGFDTLVLPDPAPGEPAPVVTITRTQDNGDGTTTRDGFVDFPDGARLTFTNFEEIICFAPGTLIDTERGRVAVEDLRPGDRVLTRDHGFQPLVWCARRDLPGALPVELAPVRIAAGALGADLPERDLVVSPRHRMLVTGARAQLLFGAREVLVAAADLVGLPGIARDAQGTPAYVHVMCARHEILRAEGAWSESFHPAAEVLGALDAATRAELLALFPDLEHARIPAARPTLTPAQARALRAA